MKNYHNHLYAYKTIYFLIAIVLVVLAALRPPGLDRDSLIFIQHLDDSFSQINFLNKEPTFWLFQQFNSLVFNQSHVSFFAFYAIIAVTIKLRSFIQLSQYPYFSLFIYFTYFYILQDLTQFRSGVAIAIFFWSLLDVVHRKVMTFYAKIFLASMFHYSAVLLFFIYFLKSRMKLFDLLIYMLLPVLGFIFYYYSFFYDLIPVVAAFLGGPIEFKVEAYYTLLAAGNMKPVNPTSMGNLFLIFVYFYSVCLAYKKYRSGFKDCFFYKVYSLSVKLMGIGIFVFFSMYFIEAFSNRMVQYFYFPLVVIVPYLVYNTRPRFPLFFIFVAFFVYTFVKLFVLDININALQ